QIWVIGTDNMRCRNLAPYVGRVQSEPFQGSFPPMAVGRTVNSLRRFPHDGLGAAGYPVVRPTWFAVLIESALFISPTQGSVPGSASFVERLRSLAGPAAGNVMPRITVMPARSSATLCSAANPRLAPAVTSRDHILLFPFQRPRASRVTVGLGLAARKQ